MQKLLTACVIALVCAGCAAHDTITTSTPTGPGVTAAGDSGAIVETVPSGLGPHGTGPGSGGTAGGNGASSGPAAAAAAAGHR